MQKYIKSYTKKQCKKRRDCSCGGNNRKGIKKQAGFSSCSFVSFLSRQEQKKIASVSLQKNFIAFFILWLGWESEI
jgi:hypothetical protein